MKKKRVESNRGQEGEGNGGRPRDKKKEVDLMKRKWLSALLSRGPGGRFDGRASLRGVSVYRRDRG